MKYLITLFFILTNGRPMSYVLTIYPEAPKHLGIYHDHFNRKWIAHNKWGIPRLKYKDKK